MAHSKHDEILSVALDYADHVTLRYNQNNFNLSFSVLDYVNSDLNKYEYQLEGYDENGFLLRLITVLPFIII